MLQQAACVRNIALDPYLDFAIGKQLTHFQLKNSGPIRVVCWANPSRQAENDSFRIYYHSKVKTERQHPVHCGR